MVSIDVIKIDCVNMFKLFTVFKIKMYFFNWLLLKKNKIMIFNFKYKNSFIINKLCLIS